METDRAQLRAQLFPRTARAETRNPCGTMRAPARATLFNHARAQGVCIYPCCARSARRRKKKKKERGE